MRSFTKKNVPYTEELYHLIYGKDVIMVQLREFLDSDELKKAYINVLTLFAKKSAGDNITVDDRKNTVSHLIKAGAKWKSQIEGFHNNWRTIDKNNSLRSELNQIYPNPIQTYCLLRPGDCILSAKNELQIAAGKGDQTHFNICELLALKEVMRFAEIRSWYEHLFGFNVRGELFLKMIIYNTCKAEVWNYKAIKDSKFSFAAPNLSSQYSAVEPNFNDILHINPVKNKVTLKSGTTVFNSWYLEGSTRTWIRQNMTSDARYMPAVNGYSLVSLQHSESLIEEFINGHINSLSTSSKHGSPKWNIDVTGKQDTDNFPIPEGQLFQSFNILNSVVNNIDSYGNAKLSLVLAQGLYCAFCETPLNDGRNGDIEHKLPKSIFPGKGIVWENFVHACKVCNADNKGTKIVRWKREGLKNKYEMKSKKREIAANGTEPEVNDNINKAGKVYETFKSIFDWSTDKIDLIVESGSDYINNNFFTSKNLGKGVRDFTSYLNIATHEVSWPDNLSKDKKKSFEKRTFDIPLFITKMSGVSLLDAANGRKVFKVKTGPNSYFLSQITSLNQQDKNLISICGLNQSDSKAYWNDQRIIRRTKATFHAIEQIKVLKPEKNKFTSLRNYYEFQLDRDNIKGNKIQKGSGGVEIKASASDIQNLHGDADIKKWDDNFKDLKTKLGAADQMMQSQIWQNILNMVKDGGFYSTWVRTFESECKRAGVPRYDIHLVRDLEIESQSNTEDPFQFHGTDAFEIMNVLKKVP